MMYLVHWSEIDKVQRYSGVFAASTIPSSLTFGPYEGPLNILLKTNEHKRLDYILEVRQVMSVMRSLHSRANQCFPWQSCLKNLISATIRNNIVNNEILRMFTIYLPKNSRDFRIYIVVDRLITEVNVTHWKIIQNFQVRDGNLFDGGEEVGNSSNKKKSCTANTAEKRSWKASYGKNWVLSTLQILCISLRSRSCTSYRPPSKSMTNAT